MDMLIASVLAAFVICFFVCRYLNQLMAAKKPAVQTGASPRLALCCNTLVPDARSPLLETLYFARTAAPHWPCGACSFDVRTPDWSRPVLSYSSLTLPPQLEISLLTRRQRTRLLWRK